MDLAWRENVVLFWMIFHYFYSKLQKFLEKVIFFHFSPWFCFDSLCIFLLTPFSLLNSCLKIVIWSNASFGREYKRFWFAYLKYTSCIVLVENLSSCNALNGCFLGILFVSLLLSLGNLKEKHYAFCFLSKTCVLNFLYIFLMDYAPLRKG